MLRLGIKVTKVNFVAKYRSRAFAKEYIELIPRLHAEELERLYGEYFQTKANYDGVHI